MHTFSFKFINMHTFIKRIYIILCAFESYDKKKHSADYYFFFFDDGWIII